ncbi:hypothetical protein LGR54_19700 [Ancylobacter sp. Lp-2]|uniref:hypothetical protein n=1 Tax=Ancylobacter sp. Lp-2 TaxID=2881339 RepID=UPI001E3A1EBA|nr:hypothetical protein [Ancylobacter sp. Lp-2]MCB4770841.1 hypothetical protein [Ancylobacter sp. Lp-2]
MPDLDELYGEVVIPARVGEAERALRPKSLSWLLDGWSARALAAHMDTVRASSMGTVLGRFLPVLWVVEATGGVRFAFEEIVAAPDEEEAGRGLPQAPPGQAGQVDWQNAEHIGPKPATLPLPIGHEKLGHPSLFHDHDKVGRIGGELIWDERYGLWFLTNRSGRYGGFRARPDLRTPQHLENAARLFRRHGVNVTAYFYA